MLLEDVAEIHANVKSEVAHTSPSEEGAHTLPEVTNASPVEPITSSEGTKNTVIGSTGEETLTSSEDAVSTPKEDSPPPIVVQLIRGNPNPDP